jgi:3-hydroxyisobutyrate dehydrogenase-like beta-hydroxyacid dehydrogenase
METDRRRPQPTVGLIGLGLVGTALAQRLRHAGFGCVGYDLRADARDRHAAAGGQPAASPADVGRMADVIVLAVFDTQDVLTVTEGAGGLLEGGTPAAIVDCSTGDPEALAALASRLAARGVGFIEAPLSGSSAQIAAGEATMLLGGDSKVIEAHAAVLDALATRRFHLGGAGMGARAKLATNLVLGLNRAVLAEGLVFAEKLGIPPAQFLELVLASPARSDAAAIKGPLMVNGDFAPQSRIRQHLKDVELMLQQAQTTGQRLPLSQAHAALMRAAIEAGDGDLDNAAIVLQLRRETL